MKLLFLPIIFPALSFGALSPADAEFFERSIRPVLVSECVECHGLEKQKGGLRLDYRDGWKKGGDSGAVIVPGEPAKSLLIKAIRHEEPEMKMPEKRPKLSAETIANFEKWIASGAPDPRDEPPKEMPKVAWESLVAERVKWWSLQPVLDPQVPGVSGWSEHAVDRFLLSKMNLANLQPAADADPAVLVRRISFLLTGLPPSPDEVQAFLAADVRTRVQALTERLLASPRFGEHWGRHWLDLVRYAETHGSESDPEIPEAWRYRDFVIRAMNDDVPWNTLIREHVAGDLLAQPRWNRAEGWNESALGIAHLRLVEHGFQPVDTRDEQVKTVDSQIDVITKAFQGITVSCARCHDHKFDAVSQRDYTAMAGVFESSRPAMITIDAPEKLSAGLADLAALKAKIRTTLADAWMKEAATFPERLLGAKGRVAKLDDASKSLADIEREVAELRGKARARIRASRKKETTDLPLPFRRWSFDQDAAGGTLVGDAKVQNGRLLLTGKGYFRSAPLGVELREKTLETWVALANLEQKGSGVLTVENAAGDVFDSIVFAELQQIRWMAGSENFKRVRDAGGFVETAPPSEPIHVAIVYRASGEIAVFRNGVLYGKPWTPAGPLVHYGKDAHVLVGLRHLLAPNSLLRGEVDEARVYDRALSPAEIAASFRAGPALEVFTPEEIAAAFTDSEREVERALSAKHHAASLALALIKSDGNDAWSAAIADAEKNSANPLHAWLNPAPANASEVGVLGDEQLVPFRHGPGVAEFAAGDFVVLPDGERAISELFPKGAGTGLVTRKHGGIASTPRFQVATDFISIHAAGAGAQCRLIVDGYPLGVNPIYPRASLNSPEPRWTKIDVKYRRGSWAYLEFSAAQDTARREKPDERSWFFINGIQHHDGAGPQDEKAAWAGLFGEGSPEIRAGRFRDAVSRAAQAWRDGGPADAKLLNALVERSLLSTGAAKELVDEYRRLEAAIAVPRRAPGVIEADSYDAAFLPRGDHLKPGKPVPRGYIAALTPAGLEHPQKASGRLQIADALTAPANPLTARVMVNRIWLHVFGRGLVATPDNFGKMGEPPSHPELLDHLATRFAAEGWSLKTTLRYLISTRAFQIASEPSAAALERDPGNELLSHARVRRLTAESIRDTLLAVSGKLDVTPFGPPDRAGDRRSVFQSIRRTSLNPFLTTFDAPKPFSTLGLRDATNVPAQSLTMMNDAFVLSCAEAWAKRQADIPAMFVAGFGRTATVGELEAARGYAAGSLRDLAHALMNAKEFIYLR